MIKRLVNIKSQLNDVPTANEVDLLRVADWGRLGQLCSLLEPFWTQTNMLQTDASSPSIVIPSLLELQCHLQAF